MRSFYTFSRRSFYTSFGRCFYKIFGMDWILVGKTNLNVCFSSLLWNHCQCTKKSYTCEWWDFPTMGPSGRSLRGRWYMYNTSRGWWDLRIKGPKELASLERSSRINWYLNPYEKVLIRSRLVAIIFLPMFNWLFWFNPFSTWSITFSSFTLIYS